MNNNIETIQNTSKTRILLVDDEPFVLSATKKFFEKHYINIEICCAKNGHEAIQFAYNNTPDLIILDIHMPGMNGRKVLDFVKNNTRTRKARIITVSSFYDKLEEMLFYGSDVVIEKPFSSSLLSSAIGQIMPQMKLRKKGQT